MMGDDVNNCGINLTELEALIEKSRINVVEANYALNVAIGMIKLLQKEQDLRDTIERATFEGAYGD